MNTIYIEKENRIINLDNGHEYIKRHNDDGGGMSVFIPHAPNSAWIENPIEGEPGKRAFKVLKNSTQFRIMEGAKSGRGHNNCAFQKHTETKDEK